jgi:hypothetical protein
LKCSFCAETIQDEARLCRFCGARMVDGNWQAPLAVPAPPVRTNFALQSSGWLLVLSGVWGLVTITGRVPLFGEVRGGAVAVLYNGVMAGAFLAMGVGLAQLRVWTLRAAWVASAVYTLDKALFFLDATARRAALAEGMQLLATLSPGMEGLAEQLALLVSGLFLLGWWGFMAFVYLKRGLFQRR